MKQGAAKPISINELKIGSTNYSAVSKEIKEFLKFNGYSQTLQKMEAEERKLLAVKKEEQKIETVSKFCLNSMFKASIRLNLTKMWIRMKKCLRSTHFLIKQSNMVVNKDL